MTNAAILLLLAAGREALAMAGSSRRAAEMWAMVHTGDVQPGTRVSFIAADRDRRVGRLDTIAGSEFVDDRIRLRE
jgi:hypothetical protein